MHYAVQSDSGKSCGRLQFRECNAPVLQNMPLHSEMLNDVATVTFLPELVPFSVDVRPHFQPYIQLYTVFRDSACSAYTATNRLWICAVFTPSFHRNHVVQCCPWWSLSMLSTHVNSKQSFPLITLEGHMAVMTCYVCIHWYINLLFAHTKKLKIATKIWR